MLFLVAAVLGLAIFLFFIASLFQSTDNREPYQRDAQGRVLALRIHGIEGNLPSHEMFIHDGTGHQNPAVYSGMGGFLWLQQTETRYYPITDNGTPIDWAGLERRIADAQRQGYDVRLIGMTAAQERQCKRRENGEQIVLKDGGAA